MNVSVAPDAAFALCLAGVIGILIEALSPGKILPAIFGFVFLGAGSYELFGFGIYLRGAVFIAISLVLLFAGAYLRPSKLFAAAGTATLIFGSSALLQRPGKLSVSLVVPSCLALGVLANFLMENHVRARQNKKIDLQ